MKIDRQPISLWRKPTKWEWVTVLMNLLVGVCIIHALNTIEIPVLDLSLVELLRPDRILHLIAGAILGLCMPIGYLFAFLAGFGKEFFDVYFGTGFDIVEVGVTGLGGVLSSIAGRLL